MNIIRYLAGVATGVIGSLVVIALWLHDPGYGVGAFLVALGSLIILGCASTEAS